MVEGNFETRIESVAIDELQVDHTYQRGLDTKRCARIAAEIDPDLFGIIYVSERTDGSLWIIDGQHRVGAVRHLARTEVTWRGQRIDAKIYRGLTVAQEALMFYGLNGHTAVRPVEKFLAGLQGGHEPEVSIARVLGEVGLRVGKYSSSQTISCVGTLTRIYRGAGLKTPVLTHPHALRMTLQLVIEAFEPGAETFNGDFLCGLGGVVLAYFRHIDKEVLRKRLATYPGGVAGILRDARGLASMRKGKVSVSVSAIVIDHYNKGRQPKNRLEHLQSRS